MFLQYSSLLISLKEGPAGWAAFYPLQLIAHRCKCRKWRLPIDSSVYHKAKRYRKPYLYWLVILTCFNNLEKYEFVNGKDDIPYMKWKIKNVWNHPPDPTSIYLFLCLPGLLEVPKTSCWPTQQKRKKQETKIDVGHQNKLPRCIVLTSYPQSSLSFPHSFTWFILIYCIFQSGFCISKTKIKMLVINDHHQPSLTLINHH